MSANSFILFVRLWWSALQSLVSGGLFWRNEDANGARWISCFSDLSERMLQSIPKQTNLFNAAAIFTDTYAAHDGRLIIHNFIYLLHTATSEEDFYITIHRPFSPIIEALETSLEANWYSYLLPAQLIVHLYPLHFLQTLLQPLVALPQLSDVVARFRQNASFALEGHRVESWAFETETSVKS